MAPLLPAKLAPFPLMFDIEKESKELPNPSLPQLAPGVLALDVVSHSRVGLRRLPVPALFCLRPLSHFVLQYCSLCLGPLYLGVVIFYELLHNSVYLMFLRAICWGPGLSPKHEVERGTIVQLLVGSYVKQDGIQIICPRFWPFAHTFAKRSLDGAVQLLHQTVGLRTVGRTKASLDSQLCTQTIVYL